MGLVLPDHSPAPEVLHSSHHYYPCTVRGLWPLLDWTEGGVPILGSMATQYVIIILNLMKFKLVVFVLGGMQCNCSYSERDIQQNYSHWFNRSDLDRCLSMCVCVCVRACARVRISSSMFQLSTVR